MKKGRINGKGRFKGLLLAHGEKIGILLVGLYVVWLMYSGLGQERLEPSKQPSQLTQRAQSAKQNISKITYNDLPADKKLSPVDYRPAAEMKQIELGKYSIQTPLNPPEFPPKIKRKDPQLLPVEELEVHGGVGLLAMIDPNADRTGRGGVASRGTPGRGEGIDAVRRPMPSGRRSGAQAPAPRSTRATSRNSRRGAAGRGGEGGYGYGPPAGGRGRGGYGEDDAYGSGGAMGEGIGGTGASLTEILPQGGVRLGPGDKVEAHYWAVVLAKVPVTKQMELYHRAFRDAEFYEPQYDTPNYFGYIVQRAEITGDGAAPQWKQVAAVSERKLMDMTRNWSSEAPPIIDPRYAYPPLTFPLPPLVGRDWDPAMVKLSDVPLASIGGRFGEGDLGPQGDDATGAEGKVEVDEHGFEKGVGGAPDGTGVRGLRGLSGGRGGYGGARGGYGESGYGGRGGYGGARGGYGEGGYGRGGYGEEGVGRRGVVPPGGGRRGGYGAGAGSPMARGLAPSRARGRMPQTRRGGYGEGGYGEGIGYGGGYGGGYGMQQEEIPFALFRFFDFSVKPGHRYQYRVQIALRDPNDQVEQKYLSDAVITRRESQKNSKYVLTDWSGPSPVVMVPFPGQVFAGPVKYVRPDQFYNEPTANVLAKMLDDKESVEGVAELDRMRRGKVANFKQSTEVIDYNQLRPALRKIDNFEFLTNVMLVDVRGGAPVSQKNRQLTAPGELLLLDPAGRLVVRKELDDAEQYKQLHALLDAASAQENGRRGRAGPGEGRGGYGGYGERGPMRGGYSEGGVGPQDRGGRARGRGQSSRGGGRGN